MIGMMLQVLPFNACVSKKLLRSPGDFKGDGVIVNESMRVAIKIGPNRFTNKAFCSTFSVTDASQTVSILVWMCCETSFVIPKTSHPQTVSVGDLYSKAVAGECIEAI